MAGRFPCLRFIAVSLLLVPVGVTEAQDTTLAASAGTTSVLKGVYTDGQAKKGESTYAKFCVSCHDAIEHAGDVFEEAWVGRPVVDFFNKIRTTMPDDEPGKLNEQQYTDIVAYMLKLTGYPAGSAVLSSDADQMRTIMVERRPKPSAPSLSAAARRPYSPHSGPATSKKR